MMNYEQVKALFAREAVLFGMQDAVPESRVIEVFGECAVEKAKRNGKGGRHFNARYFNEELVLFHFFEGFCEVATYANLEELARSEEAHR